MDEINQAIEAAKQELAILEAEIATLKARKSIIECIRKDYSREPLTGVLKRKVRRKALKAHAYSFHPQASLQRRDSPREWMHNRKVRKVFQDVKRQESHPRLYSQGCLPQGTKPR